MRKPGPDAVVGTDTHLRAGLEPATPFVGRRAELVALGRLLDDPATRLLTLIGPPGVGKTRVALELAAAAEPRFPGSVLHSALAGVRDPSHVIPTILHDVGLKDVGAGEAAAHLVGVLAGRPTLLLLDNLEQVIEAAPEVAGLLAACPELTVLATSRRPLDVAAERTAVVRPLDTPAPEVTSPDDILAHDAVALLVRRMQAADARFRPDAGSVSHLAVICRRLEGLPLAIELVAPRIRVLSVGEIAASLEHRLRALGRGLRDAPGRHRTMRDAVAWSVDSLDEPTARAFRHLSVFNGGWTIDAAGAVLTGMDRDEIIDVLDDLVNRSLVLVERADERARYRMLEVIREVGVEQLEAAGEADTARNRHGRHVLRFAEEAAGRLAGPELGPQLDTLEGERDNIRAALRWAVDRQDARGALRLCVALRMLWYVRGSLREGRAIFDEALMLPNEDRALRSRALAEAAALARQQGDLTAAAGLADEAVEAARVVADPRALRGGLLQRGFVAHLEGDLALARHRLDESAALARAAGDEPALARAIHHLGIVAAEEGDAVAAADLLGEALRLFRRHQVDRQVAATLLGMADLARSRRDHPTARRRLSEGLSLLAGLRDVPILAYALQTAANIAAAEGRHDRALRLLGAVEGVERTSGARPWPAGVRVTESWLPDARRRLGRHRSARLRAAGGRLSPEAALAHAADPDAEATPDPLSRREHEVAALVAEGLGNREIGGRLFLSERTVDGHVGRILSKLGFRARTQIAAWVRSPEQWAASPAPGAGGRYPPDAPT